MKSLTFVAILGLVVAMALSGPSFAQLACSSVDLEAGPIWNQGDAEGKCPSTCGDAGYTWNGQWVTTVQGAMSVCGCVANTVNLEAGPIWNQGDAEGKCPTTCSDAGRNWNGQWWTTVEGAMSVCQCTC